MMLPGFPDAQPLQGALGGVLIGLAAALMLLGSGRIAGVSGIVARGTRIASGDMSMTSAWGFLVGLSLGALRSDVHTSELQSLMRHSYAVFCLKKKILLHHYTAI